MEVDGRRKGSERVFPLSPSFVVEIEVDEVEYKRRYYRKHREKILAHVQDYRQANLERIAKYRAKNGLRIASRTIVRHARMRAVEKGVPFSVVDITADSVEERLRANPFCESCQIGFEFGPRVTKKTGPGETSATLDRIRNELGYVAGNTALLCWPCNKAKSTLSVGQLRSLVKWLEKCR